MSTAPKRAEDVFLAAVGKATPTERAAFLDEVCAGDPGLRRRVETLLQAHDELGSSLDKPDANPGATDADPSGGADEPRAPAGGAAEAVGGRVGPYKLLQKLAEGGMGVVWVAEQQEPVKRRVALKVIKPGMDSAQILRRFEAERQALALMDHTNIAKVLDAGATAAGRPYFVMELVHGVPITRYCDELHLPVRERLGLFVQVCQAIQHAHQKGIIHRDVKPSNVLVSIEDGRPVPKVIDFGLAKALHHRLTEGTVYTAIGAVVGTLEYMSPEQAEMSPLGVDTRADVYALGVLLYELLTGTTPLDRARLRKAAYPEMVRLIREEVPVKPSTRLTRLKESPAGPAGPAALPRTEPERLAKELRGELDWIVLKALEKDRTRRYAAASDFARDVERYLHDEPVEACPPSAGYRLAKFVRRHKGPVLATAGLVLLLVAGIVGTTWGLVRADRARTAEAEQRRLAQQNEQDAKAAAATAEAREAETRAVLDFVENKVLAAARPEGQEGGLGRDVMLRTAVEAALPTVEQSFRRQPLIEARLRLTLGKSFLYLGDAESAATEFKKARSICTEQLGPDHRETLTSVNDLADSYAALGRYAEALQLREQTLALRREKLGPDDPDTLASMNSVARGFSETGRASEAAELFEQTLALRKAKLGADHPDTLATLHGLSQVYTGLGRLQDVVRLSEETVALRKARLGPDHPDTLASMSTLAITYWAQGRQAEALKLREEVLDLYKQKLGPDHPDTLTAMAYLAVSYGQVGRPADALKLNEETLALRKKKLGPDHPVTLSSMANVASGYAAVGRLADAATLGEETLALERAKLGGDNPQTLVCMANLANAYSALGRHADALKLLEEALAMQKVKLGAKHPLTRLTTYNIACCHALFVPKAADRAKQAGLAMEWLRQAVAAGYQDLAQFKRDTDLDPLRDREDFKVLLAGLEAGKGKKGLAPGEPAGRGSSPGGEAPPLPTRPVPGP